MGFIRRRFGRLPRLLADYPPFLTPYPGEARLLSVGQCEQNLQYLLDMRDQRLEIAGELLAHFGIDLYAGLQAEDPRDLLDSLDRWARAHWPTAYRQSLSGTPLTWLNLPKTGRNIVFAMLMDLAIVMGEIVTAKRPDYAWRLDLAPDNREMLTYRRVVLAKAPHDPRWTATPLDFEYVLLGKFDWFGRGLGGYPLGYMAEAALAGGNDPVDNRLVVLEPRDAPQLSSPLGPHVYDKADYHMHTLEDEGADPEQAVVQSAVHTAYFLGWLVARGLLCEGYESGKEIDDFRARDITAVDLYEHFGARLSEDMLTEEGNAFARSYYRSESPNYLDDYEDTLAAGLPSVYHVPYTFEIQDQINAVIDSRYAGWLRAKS